MRSDSTQVRIYLSRCLTFATGKRLHLFAPDLTTAEAIVNHWREFVRQLQVDGFNGAWLYCTAFGRPIEFSTGLTKTRFWFKPMPIKPDAGYQRTLEFLIEQRNAGKFVEVISYDNQILHLGGELTYSKPADWYRIGAAPGWLASSKTRQCYEKMLALLDRDRRIPQFEEIFAIDRHVRRFTKDYYYIEDIFGSGTPGRICVGEVGDGRDIVETLAQPVW